MLSKRKMAEATMTWLRQQLEDAKSCGMSLRDDNDGMAIRIERVQQFGILLYLDLSATDGGSETQLNYCLLLQQQMPQDKLNRRPTPGELAVIDDTA